MLREVSLASLILIEACGTLSETEKRSYEEPPFGRMPEVSYADNAVMAVTLEEKVREGFQFMYQYVEETEFVLCLEGKRIGNRIHVTNFRLARMRSTSAYNVAYEDCTSKDYVGTAHNHPPEQNASGPCYQSQADARSFREDARAVVDIVLCGDHKFLWVLKSGHSNIENRNDATK